MADQRRTDPTNFQTLCHACHSRKTLAEGRHVYGPKVTRQRWVVYGPPGCGKTTWVQQRAHLGDLVFDLDQIAAAMSRLPTYPRPPYVVGAILAMRTGFLDWLQRSACEADVYLIVADEHDARTIAASIGAYTMRPNETHTASVSHSTEGGR